MTEKQNLSFSII